MTNSLMTDNSTGMTDKLTGEISRRICEIDKSVERLLGSMRELEEKLSLVLRNEPDEINKDVVDPGETSPDACELGQSLRSINDQVNRAIRFACGIAERLEI